MSTPVHKHEHPIQGALMELMSASSSLRMLPETMDDSERDQFLCESDVWAKHSLDHIRAAMSKLHNLGNLDELLQDAIFFFRQGDQERTWKFLRAMATKLRLNPGLVGDFTTKNGLMTNDMSILLHVDEEDFSVENAWALYAYDVVCELEERDYEYYYYYEEE